MIERDPKAGRRFVSDRDRRKPGRSKIKEKKGHGKRLDKKIKRV